MKHYTETMNDLTSSMAKDICEDEKTHKAISGITATLIGSAAGMATVNPSVGLAVKAGVNGLSRSHSKEVAQVGTELGLMVVVAAGSIVALPVLAVVGIWKAIFD
jgi:hypothetical protein